MKITDGYSLTADKYQWVLHSHYLGKDRDGHDKMQTKDSYHAKLEHVANAIADKEARAIVESLSESVQAQSINLQQEIDKKLKLEIKPPKRGIAA